MNLDVSLFNTFCRIVNQGGRNRREGCLISCKLIGDLFAKTRSKDRKQVRYGEFALAIDLYEDCAISLRIDLYPDTARRDNFCTEKLLAANELRDEKDAEASRKLGD